MMCGTCKKCGEYKGPEDALAWHNGSYTGGGISTDEVCRKCAEVKDER